MPLSDLSVLLSLFPSFRFGGWQWVLVVLAAPVVGWAAWPFHAAALKNARHGSVSMDTLVSLGITAACGWSVFAMFVLDRGQARLSAWYLLLHASGGGIYLEVAASVTTFLLAGRVYEARARRNAGDAMRELAAAGAQEAWLLDGDGTERRVPVAELASEHPVAAAIAGVGRADAGPLPQAAGFAAMPGLGARGCVDGHEVAVGREDLLGHLGMTVPAAVADQCRRWEQADRTPVLAGWDGQVRGAVAVADALKPSAAAAVAGLRRLGLRTILLTGDSQATAQTVAAEAGIDEVIAGALPDHKAAMITGLQAEGHRVAMVGDGVNDGPALATADLGLALGTGTDVAITAADMIVLRNDLGAVPDAIALARGTLATIRGNLAWAFGYNIAAIPLAAAGFLNPLIAGAAMAASSAFVVANSARLRKFGAPAPARRPSCPPERAGPGCDREPAGSTEPAETGERVA